MAEHKNLSAKENRERCWAARDSYFDCLSKVNEDTSKCKILVKSN